MFTDGLSSSGFPIPLCLFLCLFPVPLGLIDKHCLIWHCINAMILWGQNSERWLGHSFTNPFLKDGDFYKRSFTHRWVLLSFFLFRQMRSWHASPSRNTATGAILEADIMDLHWMGDLLGLGLELPASKAGRDRFMLFINYHICGVWLYQQNEPRHNGSCL